MTTSSPGASLPISSLSVAWASSTVMEADMVISPYIVSKAFYRFNGQHVLDEANVLDVFIEEPPRGRAVHATTSSSAQRANRPANASAMNVSTTNCPTW